MTDIKRTYKRAMKGVVMAISKITKSNKSNAQEELTMTQEKLNEIIASAVAQALAQTPQKKSAKKSAPKTQTHKKSAPQKKATKVEPLTLVADECSKTVGFSRFVRNRNVFGYVDSIVSENGGAYSRSAHKWVFTRKDKFNKFCKVVADIDLNALTEEQLNDGYKHNKNKSTYTDEQKAEYKATFDNEWAKWVAECNKKGIKRTSEMNKAKAREIRQSIA